MANVATDFGMILSLVIEIGALRARLRSTGLRPLGLGLLEIGRRAFFRMRRELKISPCRQKADQSEYAPLDSQHRHVILRDQSSTSSFRRRSGNQFNSELNQSVPDGTPAL